MDSFSEQYTCVVCTLHNQCAHVEFGKKTNQHNIIIITYDSPMLFRLREKKIQIIIREERGCESRRVAVVTENERAVGRSGFGGVIICTAGGQAHVSYYCNINSIPSLWYFPSIDKRTARDSCYNSALHGCYCTILLFM